MKHFKILSFNLFKRRKHLLISVFLKEGKVIEINSFSFSSRKAAVNKMHREISSFTTNQGNVFYTTKLIQDSFAKADVKHLSIFCQISTIKV